jgi:hypothetical protein
MGKDLEGKCVVVMVAGFAPIGGGFSVSRVGFSVSAFTLWVNLLLGFYVSD